MKKPMVLLGTRELARSLVQLKKTTAKSVSRKAMGDALIPVAEVARRLAPVRATSTGRSQLLKASLRSTIGVGPKLTKRQRKISKPLGQVDMFVGPGIAGSGNSAARHAHLVEFGTRQRFTKGKGGRGRHSTGAMPARPFMEPAWDLMKGKVWGTMVKTYSKILGRYKARGKIK